MFIPSSAMEIDYNFFFFLLGLGLHLLSLLMVGYIMTTLTKYTKWHSYRLKEGLAH